MSQKVWGPEWLNYIMIHPLLDIEDSEPCTIRSTPTLHGLVWISTSRTIFTIMKHVPSTKVLHPWQGCYLSKSLKVPGRTSHWTSSLNSQTCKERMQFASLLTASWRKFISPLLPPNVTARSWLPSYEKRSSMSMASLKALSSTEVLTSIPIICRRLRDYWESIGNVNHVPSANQQSDRANESRHSEVSLDVCFRQRTWLGWVTLCSWVQLQ